ncbi:response regulator [Maribacter sp. 2210JD10-5]|uniref:response regulator n=1 Tax=Maribacter sp. 2210JD10-5 TaxID=3386272 RepID=UPI0039BD0AFB
MLQKIMLIDDNAATNYIHKKFIGQAGCASEILAFQNGQDALDHLDDTANIFPELIFIDINMPTMDAWEFLKKYEENKREEKERTIIILLTTDLSPLDLEKIETVDTISDIMIKPLNIERVHEVLNKFFKKLA